MSYHSCASSTVRALAKCVGYCQADGLTVLAFLDRVNIANANIFGMTEDLNLIGNRYNVAVVIFFVPYCLFEIPSNILLKKFKPHVWLGANMFLFGLVTMLQGFVQNYSGLLTTRFFLGVFETGASCSKEEDVGTC